MSSRDIDIDVAGNVAGQAFDFHFAQHLFENATFGLHAGGNALEFDGHADAERFVHGNALQIDVQQDDP